jgi:hypothetical protein
MKRQSLEDCVENSAQVYEVWIGCLAAFRGSMKNVFRVGIATCILAQNQARWRWIPSNIKKDIFRERTACPFRNALLGEIVACMVLRT